MNFVITADWHIRSNLPRCRKDNDWYETQWKAMEQIKDFANEKQCPIFIVGDIFHSNGETSFYCIQMIQKLARKTKCGIYLLAGNHDLIFHSSENIERSAIGILMRSKKIKHT